MSLRKKVANVMLAGGVVGVLVAGSLSVNKYLKQRAFVFAQSPCFSSWVSKHKSRVLKTARILVDLDSRVLDI